MSSAAQPFWSSLRPVFQAATVGVAGLGGLGSHVALSLARSDVGKLVLVDFDRVDESNLNRQQYTTGDVGRRKTDALRDHIVEAAPGVRVVTHAERVTDKNVERLFVGCDVVVEAFDQVSSKAMILQAFGREPLRRVPLVMGSGVAGIAAASGIVTRRLTGNVYTCGDGVSTVGEGVALLAPRVMIVAGHQALQVLRVLAAGTG